LDTFTLTIDWGEGVPETFFYSAGTTSYSETHQYLDDNPTGTPNDDYTISVTITDDDTGSDSDTTTVTVNNEDPVITSVSADPNPTQINLVTSFTGSFTDVGTQDTHTATWDWGDSSPVEAGTVTQGSGTGTVTGSHTYTDYGVYTVTLTVTDDDTGQDPETLRVVVLPYSDITNSGLCPNFDREPETEGDQFNIIYTPDVNGDPNLYKLTATNPGQFYYNVFHVGDIVEGVPFSLNIPNPFETQGANPIHVYDGADIVGGCYVPGTDISDQFAFANFGKALYFDGNDYIRVSNKQSLEITGELTIEAWVNAEAYGTMLKIVCKRDSSQPFYFIGVDGDKLYAGIADNTNGYGTGVTAKTTVLPLNEWHHVAVTYSESAGEIKLYLDGELKETKATVEVLPEFDADVLIGAQQSGGPTQFFRGYIDEVRISSTVRDPSEFGLYGPCTPDGDTAALWHFDEGEGQEVYDSSDNDNDGILGSTGDPDTNDPTWTTSDRYGIVPLSDDSGVYYINIHLDYGLKQTTGYEPQPYDPDDLTKSDAVSAALIIEDLTDYVFSVSGPVSDSQAIQNRNVFKKIRGIAGYVDDFDSGVLVTITGPDGLLGQVTTDEDGFFGYAFHHKGKEAKYTLSADDYESADVYLKAGRFAEAILEHE
jgi:PKD repeat protein